MPLNEGNAPWNCSVPAFAPIVPELSNAGRICAIAVPVALVNVPLFVIVAAPHAPIPKSLAFVPL